MGKRAACLSDCPPGVKALHGQDAEAMFMEMTTMMDQAQEPLAQHTLAALGATADALIVCRTFLGRRMYGYKYHSSVPVRFGFAAVDSIISGLYCYYYYCYCQ